MRVGFPLLMAAPLALAACGREPEPVSVQNGVEAVFANLEDRANALEALAANQVEAAGAAELSAAAARFDNEAAAASEATPPGNATAPPGRPAPRNR